MNSTRSHRFWLRVQHGRDEGEAEQYFKSNHLNLLVLIGYRTVSVQ